MKSLEKWQFISFLSRGIAMAFGIIQSFAILRILSVSEWGIVQLVVSVGASLGIYQHLGLASASNREIAASDKNTDVFKIFATSVSVRYLVTIPLSLGLFYFAPNISNAYGFGEILFPLRLYALILLLQGVQGILNAVISGTKRFKELFIFQGAIALASVFIYVPLVYFYRIKGFFVAMLIHEGLKSVSLIIIGFKPYMGRLRFPTKKEFVKILKELFSLGMSIYIVKIIIINWEKSGANLLGFIGNAELIGVYSFALLYAKKLMHVSDSITDVNLPVFSGKFVNDLKGFKKLFSSNFNKTFSMIVFFAMSAIFWAREIISILIGSNKYDGALPLLVPMVFAFIFFSLINIIKSSLAIPAKLVKEMVSGFVLMLVSTLITYLVATVFVSPVTAMSYGMFAGALLGFYALCWLLQRKLSFTFITRDHTMIFIQAAVISLMGGIENFYIKLISYIAFVALYAWALLLARFVSKNDFTLIVDKSLKMARLR